MADYSINVKDLGSNNFSLVSVFRSPTTLASGGTSIYANSNFTSNPATGALLTATGFRVAATDENDGLGHKMRSPMEALQRGIAVVADDRAFNL